MSPSLTFIYIAEPSELDIMSCVLLASIRKHFPASVKVLGYCPEHKMHQVHPAVLKAHEMLGAEIRPMKVEGMWDTPYIHGNKILAALQPRDTDFTAFLDTDILFLQPNDPGNLIRPGHVSCSAAAWMGWTDQSIWNLIYNVFDMPVPEERIELMRNPGRVIPYFSSGLVVFPEGESPGGRFGDVWYETARILDRESDIPKRRPYLDQLSLPIAIQRAGLKWNILPEEQHFIMGGRQTGQALPADKHIYTIHYRTNDILKAAGQYPTRQKLVQELYGVRFIRRLTDKKGAAVSESEDVTGQ